MHDSGDISPIHCERCGHNLTAAIAGGVDSCPACDVGAQPEPPTLDPNAGPVWMVVGFYALIVALALFFGLRTMFTGGLAFGLVVLAMGAFVLTFGAIHLARRDGALADPARSRGSRIDYKISRAMLILLVSLVLIIAGFVLNVHLFYAPPVTG